jgi:tRNA (cytidine/uridine-2'-O-)-methyltransferase
MSGKIAFMFHIILVQPEIPPNTGNVIRLCANTGAHLHLVRPLGFEIDDTRLRRAGLDYHEWQPVQVHDNLAAALAATGAPKDRMFAMTTKGSTLIGQIPLKKGDVFVFGRETAGLSPEQLGLMGPGQRIRLPMLPEQRSLNLSNAVAVVVFEAWRQQGYALGV